MAKAPEVVKKAKVTKAAKVVQRAKASKVVKTAKVVTKAKLTEAARRAKIATAMRGQPTPAGIPPTFAPVVAAFASDSAVSRRRMFSSENVLSVNGKIFAMLGRGSLVVKLPRARVDELVKAGKGQHFDPGHGRLMKEWISVELGAAPWVALAEEAHRFVGRGD
jgi:hypothetical protein